jgi:uncharacterized BrkB/YihY/UPF0761 family membrane protein
VSVVPDSPDPPEDQPKTGSVLSRAQARVTDAVERGTAQAEAARQRWATVDALFATRERDQRAVGSVLAGAIAFRLFVYLLPLFLAVVVIMGIASTLNGDVADDVGGRLGLSRYVADSVATATRESKRSLWILVPLTLWAIYSGGLGTAKVLRSIHALAWEQPIDRMRKGWLHAVVTFGVALAIGGSIAGLQAIRQSSERAGLVFIGAEIVVLVAVWLGASLLLPHDPAASWTHLLPGAVLVGSGIWILHAVSVYFLANRIVSASEMYGSLGVAAALLAWLYILGRLLVGSAMLNSTLWHRNHPARVRSDQP